MKVNKLVNFKVKILNQLNVSEFRQACVCFYYFRSVDVLQLRPRYELSVSVAPPPPDRLLLTYCWSSVIVASCLNIFLVES